MSTHPPSRGQIIARVFIPFMLAYFLSEIFRNVNGVVGPVLQTDLGLNAAALGALTSTFFVSVAAAQLFVGILLDRFGARRTVATLLVFAVIGNLLFATGDLAWMYLGRFMIGLGVAGCWTAAFKVNAQWWSYEHLAFANGAIIGCAGLGALAATVPTQVLLSIIPWQEVFLWLAGATLVVAVGLWVWAMDHPSDRSDNPEGMFQALRGFGTVLRNPVFVVFGPISIVGQGIWLSYQGLWAGAWLREVDGLTPLAAAWFLLALATCVVLGNFALGGVASRLARHGVTTATVAVGICAVFVAVQAAIWTNGLAISPYLWSVFGFLVSGPIMVYAILSSAMPVRFGGRAVSLLNLFATLAGFTIQYGVGAIIDLWPVESDGHYPVIAHQVGFGVVIVAQIAALAWLLARWRRVRSA